MTVCFPGTYGQNSEDKCPDGTYGYLCRQKCKCNPNVICDKRFGCVDQECPPGSFGENCSEECPSGFYGTFCEEKCTYGDFCDKRNGCLGTHFPDCTCLPFFPTVFYMILAISVEAIVIFILISTTIFFARSRAHSWSIYSSPLPANTISLETQQEEDYTSLTERLHLPCCEMNKR
ncbi:cell death abnormality protein 1-like [Saccostrea cucullata]|uniref:cell death abnormality protein 1-like n=1 Tax=Saccostrea cuccullata TaxID=36930 RepID=UPI002ED0CC8D